MLSDKIWWTKKARIKTHERLLSTDLHARIILFWYSFFLVSVAIYSLRRDLDIGDTPSLVIFSVLVLVVSVFVSGLDFVKRAMLIKDCYEKMESLYAEAKTAESEDDKDAIEGVSRRYQEILGVSENHTARDYENAVVELGLAGEKISKEATNFMKVKYFFYKLYRFFWLAILYLLPLSILFFQYDYSA